MNLRQKTIFRYVRDVQCDTLLVTEPENLFYLTGFWGEAIGVLTKDNVKIFAPSLEVERVKLESKDCEVIAAPRGTAITSSLKSITSKKICTDSKDIAYFSAMKKIFPTLKQSFISLQRARLLKDTQEINLLKKASKIIDEMFQLCVDSITVDQNESQLQTILMSYAMDKGLFDTGYRWTTNPLIISGGPNGALPHAQVTNRKFRDGDLIVVDLTLRYRGYVSDATRTFHIGEMSPDAAKAYDAVHHSQQLGLDATTANATCKHVDLACRNYIDKQGFGKYFIHSTGHGIGLDVHESPAISLNSKEVLKSNMAITIEPGIYIPKKFGIRIEDSVIVTKGKPILLHKFTKEPVRI